VANDRGHNRKKGGDSSGGRGMDGEGVKVKRRMARTGEVEGKVGGERKI